MSARGAHSPAPSPSAPAPTPPSLRRAARVAWALATAAMVCVVWGNSLVPGGESGGLSMSVVATARSWLDAAGLPSGWVTNFVVRKAAHFSEYLVLAVLAFHAFVGGAPRGRGRATLACALAAFLVAVPCVDESIQRFVSVGRSGQLRDVFIDCCGAVTGVLLCLLVRHMRGGRARGAGRDGRG